ncbi:DUF551 domain-containing protein [Citrobacter sedlakii]|nr:DUF551 domain-containing protein [Citrobacter sedlakii]
MSTVTKERLEWLANISVRDEIDEIDGEEIRELARIALASLEAEPVACPKCNDTGMADSGGVQPWGEPISVPCDCTAHPALAVDAEPVAWTSEEALVEVYCGETGMIGPQHMVGNIPLYLHAQHAPVVPDEMPVHTGPREFGRPQAYVDGWNACRDAMLQGADGNAPAHFRSRPAQSSLSPAQGGNSPVIPDCWVPCSERLPEETKDPDGGATGYLVLYAEGKEPNGGFNVGVWNVTYLRQWWRGFITHWMPLPAAPQQEDL